MLLQGCYQKPCSSRLLLLVISFISMLKNPCLSQFLKSFRVADCHFLAAFLIKCLLEMR